MASLHEILTKGRTKGATKPSPKSYVLSGHRHPRGQYMPVPTCVAACLLVALVLILSIALRA